MLGSVLFFVIVLLAVSGLSRQVRGEREAFAVADGGDFQTEITSILDVVRKEEEKTVHLVAVGDNLIHEGIYESAEKSGETWNYDHLYQYIKPEIQDADLAAVNQECIFVEDHDEISAYPSFGSPTEIGDALVDAGFDIVAQANNHTFDKGVSGIRQTLKYWEEEQPDTTVLGIHGSSADAETVQTVTCKGIRFALLNYTSQINGETYSQIPSYMIDLLRIQKVKADMEKARKAGDMILVFLHSGQEYAKEPNRELRNFLQIFLDEGADIVICSHPHVLQNFETMRDEEGHEMLVYYSLGNFLSNQKKPECMLGGMADIKITKDEDTGEVSVAEADLIPLVTHYNHEKKEYAVYKLEDYTQELAAEHGIHEFTEEPFTLERMKALYEDVIRQTY